MPNASYLRYIGIARELGSSTLAAATASAATSLTLINATGFTSTSKVTIYDGANTEVVTASALAGNVLTVGATANAHGVGCLVTTVGTASAGPTAFIPVSKFDPKDDYTRLMDSGWRGSMIDVYNVVDGVRSSDLSISSDAFPDSVGYMAACLLGDVGFTTGTPATHKLAVKNSGTGQPPTYQFTDVYLPGLGSPLTRQYGGVLASDFTLNFTADAMLTWDCTASAYASGLVAKPTASFSSLVPLPALTGVLTVAGSLSPVLVDGSIEWKRNVNAIPNVDGSPHPYKIWGGTVSAAIKATVIAEDETWLNYYLNNTQPSFDLNFSTGSGSSLLAINPHFGAIGFTDGSPSMGQDYLSYDLDAVAIGQTADQGASLGYSTGYLLLKNNLPTGTYG